jgi:hypothetical protein
MPKYPLTFSRVGDFIVSLQEYVLPSEGSYTLPFVQVSLPSNSKLLSKLSPITSRFLSLGSGFFRSFKSLSFPQYNLP